MKEFKGKVAVVTGAASGIGRGLAEKFAAEGMRVVLADVEQAPLDAAAAEMQSAGADVIAVRTDVSKAAEVEALAQRTLDAFGAVHVLCNNAGVGGGGASWEQSLEDWEWVVGVNLWGVVYGLRTFVPMMLRQDDEAHIVNTASVAGLMAGAGPASYTLTKYGVVGLSEALYHELQMATGGRVGVSVLCPGLIATRIFEAGRNRPGGPPPEPEPGSQEAAMRDMIRNVFAGGMAPAEVAQKVFDAIAERRFYILTHDHFKEIVEQRAAAIVNGDPPPTAGPPRILRQQP